MSDGLEGRASAEERIEAVRTRSRAIVAIGVMVTIGTLGLSDAWVGTDRWTLALNAAAGDVWAAVSQPLVAPASEPATAIYRPLAQLSLVPGRWFGVGPFGERAVELALHVGVMVLAARLARALGAHGRAAWFGAAVFAFHPAVSEVAIWPGARGTVLAALLLLGGWLALLRDRQLPAGLMLAATPFCHETWIFVPVTALAWMWAYRKLSRATLLLCWAGTFGYAFLRHRVGLDAPHWGSVELTFANLGGLGLRLGELLVVPGAPDIGPVLFAAIYIGVPFFVVGLAAFAMQRDRPWLVPVVAPLVLLLPWAPLAGDVGRVSDQAFYPLFIGIGVVSGLALSRLGTSRLADVAWVLPMTFAAFTAQRMPDWADDGHVYGASYARDADNPWAAYEVARFMHRKMSNCGTAVQLYAKAEGVEPLATQGRTQCEAILARTAEPEATGGDAP